MPRPSAKEVEHDSVAIGWEHPDHNGGLPVLRVVVDFPKAGAGSC